MDRFRTIAAILLFAVGTLGFAHCVWADPFFNVKENRKEQREKNLRIKLIESAKRWLDVRELTGRNDHPMIARSMRLCGLPGNKGYPWCASCQTEIFLYAGISTVQSARAASWFKANIVWVSSWGPVPRELLVPGMSVGYYYPRLGRIGHIGLLAGWDKNNLYVYEGNTSPRGLFNIENFQPLDESDNTIVREGDGFYPKTRRWEDIAVISDHCLLGKDFINRYDSYIQTKLK